MSDDRGMRAPRRVIVSTPECGNAWPTRIRDGLRARDSPGVWVPQSVCRGLARSRGNTLSSSASSIAVLEDPTSTP